MFDHKTALLLVDLQNDFFPGGALGVPGAEAIFPLANEIQDYFKIVIATQDWHPANHTSFISNHPHHKLLEIMEIKGIPQILWPPHCVQGTKGSEFHPKLRLDKIHKIIHKGTDPNIDSYSTFFDNAHQKHTGLAYYLKEHKIDTLYIIGLATDYCVSYSVHDALKLGFKTFVIEDGCYGINRTPGDVERALEAMKKAGAVLINSHSIIKST